MNATEYIPREAVLALKEKIGAYGMDICSEKVKAIPAADVKPVIPAEWIEHEDDWFGNYWECSNCHDEFCMIEGDMYYKICPTCGAEMKGIKHER